MYASPLASSRDNEPYFSKSEIKFLFPTLTVIEHRLQAPSRQTVQSVTREDCRSSSVSGCQPAVDCASIDTRMQQSNTQALVERPSDKSYTTALVLVGLFGVLGLHHLYLRRWGEAMLDIGLSVTAIYFYLHGDFGLAVIVGLLDILHTVVVVSQLIVGRFRDGSGRLVMFPGQAQRRLAADTNSSHPQ